jgi:AcrR family transcriptional regulator
MGVQERRAREKELLRRKIIDAAAQLIVANGYEAFSLRQVADKIEYSASSIYLYFKNKEELIEAICAETFDELIARMDRLEARNLPPLEAFEEGIREYIRFGLQHPKHYELVFSCPPADNGGTPLSRSKGLQAFGTLARAFGRCAAEGIFRSGTPEQDVMVTWMAMHGITTILITDHGKWDLPWSPIEELIEHGVRMVSHGLKK